MISTVAAPYQVRGRFCIAGSPGAMGCPHRAQASRVMVICIFSPLFPCIKTFLCTVSNEARPSRFPVKESPGLVVRLRMSRLRRNVGDLAVVEIEGHHGRL